MGTYFTIFKVEAVSTDLVGHEFIIDLSEFYKDGITDKDVKRHSDYNFHPPTMSWPINKSIMIEPTESENKEELDRFVNAMISIKKEIEKVQSGEFDVKNNPSVNAPLVLMILRIGSFHTQLKRDYIHLKH